MKNNCKLTISIVNWNTKDITIDCLQSVFAQTKKMNFEVIVVDNGSTDGSVKAFKKQFPNLTIIENKKNIGFARANNQVIKIAKGEYILLLNSDTIVLDHALEKLVTFADTKKDGGIFGGKLLNQDRSLQPSMRNFPNPFIHFIEILGFTPLLKKTFLAKSYNLASPHTKIKEIDWLSGAFFLIRKEVISTVGLMDEDYFMYAEEMDYCFQVKKKGWKIYFYPDAQIIHLGGKSAERVKEETLINQYTYFHFFIRKNFNFVSRIIMELTTFIGLFLLILRLSLSKVIKGTNEKRDEILLHYKKLFKTLYLNGI